MFSADVLNDFGPLFRLTHTLVKGFGSGDIGGGSGVIVSAAARNLQFCCLNVKLHRMGRMALFGRAGELKG